MKKKRQPKRTPHYTLLHEISASATEPDAAQQSSVEVWRPIPGYEGFYSVSDQGRVRGERRLVPGKRGSSRELPEHVMSATNDSAGYLQVRLSRDRIGKTWKVHRLVLLAFVGDRPPRMQCCHSDGCRKNNALTNLRYDTFLANAADRIRHGTQHRGTQMFTSKLTEAQVLAIRVDGRGCREIARSYGVHHGTISGIKSGRYWAWL